MFTKEYIGEVILPSELINQYNMGDIAYFDIETTGFDKENDKIILISLGYYIDENKFHIKQYFAESIREENEILTAFSDDMKKFNIWCSYNGKAFDEPFIVYKMNKNNIEFNIPSEHIDLYRIIRPYHKQIGLERCNLKSVEKFVGVHRTDKIDGAISVQLYNEFIKNGNEEIKNTIMLHNYEDVLNLPQIFKIVKYIDDNALVVENHITKKQLSLLKFLLRKNNVDLMVNYKKISRKSASRVINSILSGNLDTGELQKLINNSY